MIMLYITKPAKQSARAAGEALSPLRRYARWLGRMPDPSITTDVELVLQVGPISPPQQTCVMLCEPSRACTLALMLRMHVRAASLCAMHLLKPRFGVITPDRYDAVSPWMPCGLPLRPTHCMS